jgi:dolichol-phosphate mannosyltransferase
MEEILFRCRQAGARIGETPIWFEDRRAGVSKITPREMAEALWVILRLAVGRLWPVTSRCRAQQAACDSPAA